MSFARALEPVLCKALKYEDRNAQRNDCLKQTECNGGRLAFGFIARQCEDVVARLARIGRVRFRWWPRHPFGPIIRPWHLRQNWSDSLFTLNSTPAWSEFPQCYGGARSSSHLELARTRRQGTRNVRYRVATDSIATKLSAPMTGTQSGVRSQRRTGRIAVMSGSSWRLKVSIFSGGLPRLKISSPHLLRLHPT